MKRRKKPPLSYRVRRHFDSDGLPDDAMSEEVRALSMSALVKGELEPCLGALGELMDLTHMLLDRFADPTRNMEQILELARDWLASENDEANRMLYEIGRRANGVAQASGNILCWKRPEVFDPDLFES